MPLFIGQFDYVVGNPPWVNWESLPDGYRSEIAYLWQDYGLFVHSGMDTILGKGKKDISTLMAYVAMDKYLKDNGKLAFVITQSVFKTAGAAQGFRRFQLPGQKPLRVIHVDDLTELQPFEGASNRTSVVILQKGRATSYPVPYTYWRKSVRGKGIDYDSDLDEVFSMVRRMELRARPVSDDDRTSPWLTARQGALKAIQKVLGKSDYEAHAGVYTGGANGVYWLEVISERPDNLLVVRNITEGAKRQVEPVTADIEPDFVYPLLRPCDVQRWCARPSAHILMVQDPERRQGIDEDELQGRCPKTYAYLAHFKSILRERRDRGTRGIVEGGGPFYSMFSVGQYTLAPYKVVWTRIASDIITAVVKSEVIPQETITLIGAPLREEADYVCAVMNSTPFRFSAVAYSQTGGKSFGSPHILENIRIPKFSPDSNIHRKLASLGQQATSKHGENLKAIEQEIDEVAAQLWGITTKELKEIQRNFAEMRGTTEQVVGDLTDEGQEADR